MCFLLALVFFSHRHFPYDRKWQLLTGLALALGAWAIPSAAIGWCCLAAAIVLRCRERSFIPLLFVFTSAIVLSILFYSPVLLSSYRSVLFGNKYIGAQSLGWLAFGWPNMFLETIRDWTVGVPIPVAIVMVVGFFVYSLRSCGARSLLRREFTFAIVIGCVGFLILRRVAPPARVWSFVLPVVVIASCEGIRLTIDSFIPGRRLPNRIVLAVYTFISFSLWYSLHRQDVLRTVNPAFDVEILIESANDSLQQGKRVMTWGPTGNALLYFLSRDHRIVPDMLDGSRLRPNQDAVFYCNKRTGQTVDHLLGRWGITNRQPERAVLFFETDGYVVYQIRGEPTDTIVDQSKH